MIDLHPDVHRILAADRFDRLSADYGPVLRRPLRLRLGLWLVRPYVSLAPARVTYARVR